MGRTPTLRLDVEGSPMELKTFVPEDILYTPSDAERLIKAEFWEVWRDNPLADKSSISPRDVAQLTGDSRILNWWKRPLFQEWFLNKDTYVHTARMLAEKGQAIILEILNDPTTRPDIRARLALEVTKNPLLLASAKPQQVRFADEAINNMTPEELRALVEKSELK